MIIKNKNTNFIIIIIMALLFSCNNEKDGKVENNKDVKLSLKKDRIDIYYFHRTKRCSGCLKLEKMMNKIIENKYQKEISSGIINYMTINVEKEEEYVKKYNLVMPGITIDAIKNNKTLYHKNLEKAWQVKNNKDKFKQFIEKNIDNAIIKVKN